MGTGGLARIPRPPVRLVPSRRRAQSASRRRGGPAPGPQRVSAAAPKARRPRSAAPPPQRPSAPSSAPPLQRPSAAPPPVPCRHRGGNPPPVRRARVLSARRWSFVGAQQQRRPRTTYTEAVDRNAAAHHRQPVGPPPALRCVGGALPRDAAPRAGPGWRLPSGCHPGNRPRPPLLPLRGAPSGPQGVRWNALPVHARLQHPPRCVPARRVTGASRAPRYRRTPARQVRCSRCALCADRTAGYAGCWCRGPRIRRPARAC